MTIMDYSYRISFDNFNGYSCYVKKASEIWDNKKNDSNNETANQKENNNSELKRKNNDVLIYRLEDEITTDNIIDEQNWKNCWGCCDKVH